MPGTGGSLEQRQAGFLAALAARDLERTGAYLFEDAVLHVADFPAVRGRAAIEGFLGNVFRFMAASEPAVETTRVSASGDLAYSTGRVANVFHSPDGPVTYRGKFLLVWERHDGEWWLTVYAVSGDGPAGDP